MAARIYTIPEIGNEIEWDGVNPPKVRRLDGKGYLRPIVTEWQSGHPFYNFHERGGKRLRISQGQLVFMLRTGVTFRQCHEYGVKCDAEGRLFDITERRRDWRLFSNISECYETLRVLEALADGDAAPLHAVFLRSRPLVQRVLWKNFYIGKRLVDELYD